MAVLPPLERTVLQSRESDADAEMSSSLSEEDALEYDMSEDLEDSPAVNSPPPSSKPQKGDKYKNSRSWHDSRWMCCKREKKRRNLRPFRKLSEEWCGVIQNRASH
ncbi:hypothetical protein AVEN_3652-1 [Araneus ventricosus]|uniref:Uncharacterized protein n=1 Tax=Araneus ventricosus TaxID=182803 RepID=A0A4Y2TS77_ARAVE|nr:hypothetical protein AVEN_3652-1 [Araneus ventricosus]